MCLQCTVAWWMASRGSSQACRLCVDWRGLCLWGSSLSFLRDAVRSLFFWQALTAFYLYEENLFKRIWFFKDSSQFNVVCFSVYSVQPWLSSRRQTRLWLTRLYLETSSCLWRRAFLDVRVLARKSFTSAASIHSLQTSWHLCQWRWEGP